MGRIDPVAHPGVAYGGCAGGGGHQPGNGPQQHGFAAAVLPGQAVNAAAFQRQVYVVQYGLATQSLGIVLQYDFWHSLPHKISFVFSTRPQSRTHAASIALPAV